MAFDEIRQRLCLLKYCPFEDHTTRALEVRAETAAFMRSVARQVQVEDTTYFSKPPAGQRTHCGNSTQRTAKGQGERTFPNHVGQTIIVAKKSDSTQHAPRIVWAPLDLRIWETRPVIFWKAPQRFELVFLLLQIRRCKLERPCKTGREPNNTCTKYEGVLQKFLFFCVGATTAKEGNFVHLTFVLWTKLNMCTVKLEQQTQQENSIPDWNFELKTTTTMNVTRNWTDWKAVNLSLLQSSLLPQKHQKSPNQHPQNIPLAREHISSI